MNGAADGGRRRVVVTGMGSLTALGPDVASTWDGLVAGRSGVRTIESFDPSRVDSKIAAEVRDFDPGDVVDRKDAALVDLRPVLERQRRLGANHRGMRVDGADVA